MEEQTFANVYRTITQERNTIVVEQHWTYCRDASVDKSLAYCRGLDAYGLEDCFAPFYQLKNPISCRFDTQ